MSLRVSSTSDHYTVFNVLFIVLVQPFGSIRIVGNGPEEDRDADNGNDALNELQYKNT